MCCHNNTCACIIRANFIFSTYFPTIRLNACKLQTKRTLDRRSRMEAERLTGSSMEGIGLNVDGNCVGTDDIYSLEWNNYNFHLASRIQNLYENLRLADVTLACEGKYLKAHKFLLCLCSSYFNRLFDANAQEKGNTIVILNNVRFTDLQNIICFMYTGKVQIPGSELQEFLKIGQLLEVEGLNSVITHTGEDDGHEPFRTPVSQNDTLENETTADLTGDKNNSGLVRRKWGSALRKRGKGNGNRNTKRLRDEEFIKTFQLGTHAESAVSSDSAPVVHEFPGAQGNDLSENNGIEYIPEDVEMNMDLKYQVYDVRTEPMITLTADVNPIAEEGSLELIHSVAPTSSAIVDPGEKISPAKMRRATRRSGSESSEKRKEFDTTAEPELILGTGSIQDSFLHDATENTFEITTKEEAQVEGSLVSGGQRVRMGSFQKAAGSSTIVVLGSNQPNYPLNGEENGNAVTINDSFYTRKIGRKRLVVYFCKHCHEEIRFKSKAITHLHKECPAVKDGKVTILNPRMI